MPNPTPTKVPSYLRKGVFQAKALTLPEINTILLGISLRLNQLDAIGQHPDAKGRIIKNLGKGLTETDSIRFDQLFNELILAVDGIIYFGDENTDGTWRLIRSGTSFNVERRESSVWVKKGAFRAS